MNYTQILLIVCPFVFLAGFVDAIAGGGGLISMPAYLAAGVPPHNMLGCNKFSSVFGATSSLYRFAKTGHIHKKIAVLSVAVALLGSAAGASIVLYVDGNVIRWILLIMLPVLLIFILLKKDFGSGKELLPAGKLLTYSAVISFFIGMYDGFFGPGTGTLLILAFTSILGYDILMASGNAKAVNWSSNIAALTVFIINGKVIFPIAIPAAACNLIGAYLGAGLAIKNGMKLIKPVFIIVILLLLAKIISDMSM